MTSDPLVLSRPAEIRAVLADSRFTVDPVPRPPFALTVAWLRGAVGRFAEGAVHAERRAEAEAVLAGLVPGALRAEAFRLASRDAGPPACPPELVPVLVLAVALGVRAEDGPEAVEAVAAIAPAYLPGPGPGPGDAGPGTADEGLARLSRLLGDPAPERLAVVAGLLAQAYAPTTGLVRAALAAAPTRPAVGASAAGASAAGSGGTGTVGELTVGELLDETLRRDPPVRTLRRRAPGGGRSVVLDVAAAGRAPGTGQDPEVGQDPKTDQASETGRDPETARGPVLARTEGEPEYLTFGAGPRACPGRQVALALAAGTVEAAAR